jgi:subtilisin
MPGHPPLNLFSIRSHLFGKCFPHRLNLIDIAGDLPPNFSFHIGKVRKDDGSFSMADVMLAANDCVDVGANVITLAISCLEDTSGLRCYKKQWERQFNHIYNQGILIIGSAGNTGTNRTEYPGAYGTVISVSAVDENRSWFENSTRNDQVEIAAPGV